MNHAKSKNRFAQMAAAVFAVTVWAAAGAGAQSVDTMPAPPQTSPVAIVGANIYPVSGPMIEKGTIVFEGGKITAIGKDVAVPEGVTRVDGAGKRVYPGLICAYSSLGLTEISAVRATNDEREVGEFNPSALAWVAFQPDSEIIPVTRSNGILTTLTAPAGGLVSGQPSLLSLDGWTNESMTLIPSVGVNINWPAMVAERGWRVEESDNAQMKRRNDQLKKLRDFFVQARAYAAAREAEGEPVAGKPGQYKGYDARFEAMLPVLDRTLPVYVVANQLAQIEAAVAFAKRENIKLVLVGGAEAGLTIDLLKRENVPVILNGVFNLPSRRQDAYDDQFTLPTRLHAAGIPFCLTTSGGPTFIRNIGFEAGNARAYGLADDVALASVTLNAAKILGAADRLGSLEVGKDATLIVTDGDILDMTANVLDAYVQGRKLDLSDRHKRLAEKFEKRLQK